MNRTHGSNTPAFRFDGWTRREPPADPAAVDELAAASGIEWPEDYLSLMRLGNGGEGPLDVEPGWFQIWPVEEVLALNHAYEVQAGVPGLFGFGSNGGGELLAFDARRSLPWRIVSVPFIGMEADAVVTVAEDFAAFLRATGRDAKQADEKSG